MIRSDNWRSLLVLQLPIIVMEEGQMPLCRASRLHCQCTSMAERRIGNTVGGRGCGAACGAGRRKLWRLEACIKAAVYVISQ